MALQGFNEEYYLDAKLAALQADPITAASWAGQDTDFLSTVLAANGFTTALSHYEAYGWTEGLAPNEYFNAAEYTTAKAIDMFEEGSGGYMTVGEALAAFEAAWPYDPYLHYLDYGEDEGLNPSNDFDVSSYYETKLAALQADPDTADEWADKTTADVEAAFDAAGFTALGHWEAYGFEEDGMFVTEVPVDEQVDPEGGSGPTPGETFTLTTGIDDVVGTTGDDTIKAVNDDNGSGDITLNLGDSIDGGAGNDTISVTANGDELLFSGVDVTNVENLYVKNVYTDFDELNLDGIAFDTVTVDYNGTNHDEYLYIDDIDGQTSLVIDNVTGYDSETFYRNYDEDYDATEGTVSVSNTVSNFDAVTEDYYSYFEGYEYFSDATEINHTFNLLDLDGGDEGFYVYEYIDSKVDGVVVNSTFNITNADTPESYAGVYGYVYNETDESSDVTTVVNITDSDGVDFEFYTAQSGDEGTSDVITYNIDNLENTYGYNYLYTYGFETINVNVLSDSEVYELYDYQDDGIDQAINIVADGDFVTDYTEFYGDVGDVTLTVSGSGDVDLGYTYLGDGGTLDVVTVDASAMTGDFTIDERYGYAASVTSGSGDDSIVVNSYETAVDTGAGDDAVDTNGYDFGDVDAETIDGGADTDTVNIEDSSLADADYMANIVNFETLEIAGANNIAAYDMDVMGFTDLKLSNTAATVAVTIENVAADALFTMTNTDDMTALGTVNYSLEDASAADDNVAVTMHTVDTAKTADNVVIAAATSAAFVVGQDDDSKGVETITLTSNATTASVAKGDDDAWTSADYTNSLSLDATEMTSLVIDGNAQAAVTFVDAAALTFVDASANEAGVAIDASTGAIAAGVTFKGSDAADTYVTSANGDLIQANGGADDITLGTGDDTVRLAAATDSQLTLVDTTDPAVTPVVMDVAKGYDVVTDFNLSGTDLIELSSLLDLATGDARSDVLQLGTMAGGTADDLDTFIGDGVDFFDTGVVDRAVAFADDATDGWVFVDANSDGDFTYADDMVVQLAGVTSLVLADVAFG